MGIISQKGPRMEGWLHLIRSNRFGLQYFKKRYFVLQGNSLDCYKAIPRSDKEDPVRSAIIDSRIHVADNGRKNVHKNILFMFTIYNASNHKGQLKLGARSSEEVSMWIRSIMEVSLKDFPDKGANGMACSGNRGQSLRLSCPSNGSLMHSTDWTTFLSASTNPMNSDVISSTQWSIFGCTNGLRLFKEAKGGDFQAKNWDNHPAIMAVGVVDANPEAIFHTLMSLGPSRSEWDFCLSSGSVVEKLDSNTDIIHKKLNADWLPRGMTKRDFVLQRYWRREDDGTYAIIYHSVFHPNRQPEKGYIRASLKNGGYVISPVNQGKQSVVRHMLAIDWKSWRSYLFASCAEYITIRMLARVAALREFFQVKLDNGACSEYTSGELIREIGLPQNEKEDIKLEVHRGCENNKNEDTVEEPQYLSPETWDMAESFFQDSYLSPETWDMAESFFQDSDVGDEFFDVPSEYVFDQSETMWPSNEDVPSQDQRHPKQPAGSVLAKSAQDYVVQERNYVDLLADSVVAVPQCSYGTTLPQDPSCTMDCSWTTADPSTFLIRGESYLQDRQKIKAESTVMEMVGADWIKSNKREDDLGGRPGGIVQKFAQQGAGKFFFIVNMQIPGSGSIYSLAFYYAMDSPLESVPLLDRFVKRDDQYRNSRFKLIPFISKGSWVVKQSVGKKACLVGQPLKLNYFRGRNYFEVDVDVGSSAVARSVNGLVLKYLNNLVIEMAFLIQGNTQDELPEVLLGTCRLSHMDVAKSVPIESLPC